MTKRRTKGLEVIRWIETHCVFTQGEWIGKPFRLQAWQKLLILALFSLRDGSNLRQYRWAYISVAKKQGKTELIAAIGLYLLIGDGESSPLIACAAAAEKQADLVFGAMKKMCELSPTLRSITERFESSIFVPSIPGAEVRRIAASAGTNDGPSWSALLLDELHEWEGEKGDKTWEVLTNGTGARRQPLILQITTAGYDKETLCGRQYEYAKQVISGAIEDPGYFAYIIEAPDQCDHRDPEMWSTYNPSFGVTVQAEFYQDQLTKKSEGTFRRYFLNQWTEAEELALPHGAWAACRSPMRLDTRLPVWVGIDFAQFSDSTGVAIAQKQGARTVVRARIWTNPYPPGDTRRDSWVVSHAEVENECRKIAKMFPRPATLNDRKRPVPGPAFYYDPARFEQSAQTLILEGLNMVRYDQTDLRMIPVAETFLALVINGEIAHDGDPVLASHVAGIRRIERPRGGWRIGKQKGKANDGAVATAMAAYEAQRGAPKVVSRAPLVAQR